MLFRSIVRVESDAGETRVIVRFNDKDTAERFVQSVKESSTMKNKKITRIGFNDGYDGSYSLLLRPAVATLLTFAW